MGRPRINMITHMMAVKRKRLGRKNSGQLSTTPVMKDSTQQNMESMPKVKIMRKKSRAHSGDGVSCKTTCNEIKKRMTADKDRD